MSVHILAECPEKIPSVELGIIRSLQPLCNDGKCEVLFKRTSEVKKKDIAWADIVVSVRGCESYSLRVIRASKKAGRLCVYFLDDDLLHIPEESVSSPYFKDIGIQRNLKAILSLSDALWGTNKRIKSIYSPMCGSERWILARMPVSIDFTAETGEEAERGCINVLYAGSVDHQLIIRDLIAPAAAKLSTEYGSGISFTFIGPDPHLPKRDNLKYKKYFENYDEYKSYVRNGNFAIGLAPTRTSDFYHAKYYNKFVEYTSIGAVGIYTNSEPYTQVVENGINGILCDNTTDDWYRCIKRLLEDADLRQRCLQNAVSFLQENYKPEAVAGFLAEQYPEFVTYHAPSVLPKEIRLMNSILSSVLGRLTLCWRQFGILSIPVIMFKAVRMLVKKALRGF